MKKSWKEFITVELDKCGGKPCIRGMRIRVVDIECLLESGMPSAEILDKIPMLTLEDILAVKEYLSSKAADSVRPRIKVA